MLANTLSTRNDCHGGVDVVKLSPFLGVKMKETSVICILPRIVPSLACKEEPSGVSSAGVGGIVEAGTGAAADAKVGGAEDGDMFNIFICSGSFGWTAIEINDDCVNP
jgi:hypothetical protein